MTGAGHGSGKSFIAASLPGLVLLPLAFGPLVLATRRHKGYAGFFNRSQVLINVGLLWVIILVFERS